MKTLICLSLIFALCSCGLEKEKEEESQSFSESVRVYDSNNDELGKLISFDNIGVSIMTDSGYIYSLTWEGKAYNFGMTIIYGDTNAYFNNVDNVVYSDSVGSFFLDQSIDRINKSFLFISQTNFPSTTYSYPHICKVGTGLENISSSNPGSIMHSDKISINRVDSFNYTGFDSGQSVGNVNAIELNCGPHNFDYSIQVLGLPITVVGPLFIR